MKHIPNKIYLQIGEDCDAEDFKDLNEVTWCQVEIHSNDIEYVRSSQQPEDEVLEALRKISELDPTKDAPSNNFCYDEWGEAECFNKAKDIAKAILKWARLVRK